MILDNSIIVLENITRLKHEESLLPNRGMERTIARATAEVGPALLASTATFLAIFLPFLFGSTAGPNASSCFVGMRGWHTRAHLLRAIYEGVVFSHRSHIDRLMAHRERPEAVRIAGGAARSAVWVQMFADILQLPVEIPATDELGAMGAAICAGVAVGLFSSFGEAVSHMVKITRVVEPNPANRQVYEKKYARYRAVIEALGRVWDRTNE